MGVEGFVGEVVGDKFVDIDIVYVVFYFVISK